MDLHFWSTFRSTFGLVAVAVLTYFPVRSRSLVDSRKGLIKSLSKTRKSYFWLSFLLISNSFFTALFVTSLTSQVDGQCQSTTQYLVGIVWSWHWDPWAFAGHDRKLPPTSCSILILQTSTHLASLLLMLLHYLSCFTDKLDHFSGRFRPLWLVVVYHGIMHCPGTRQLTYALNSMSV